jgi:hypothetical protein
MGLLDKVKGVLSHESGEGELLIILYPRMLDCFLEGGVEEPGTPDLAQTSLSESR